MMSQHLKFTIVILELTPKSIVNSEAQKLSQTQEPKSDTRIEAK